MASNVSKQFVKFRIWIRAWELILLHLPTKGQAEDWGSASTLCHTSSDSKVDMSNQNPTIGRVLGTSFSFLWAQILLPYIIFLGFTELLPIYRFTEKFLNIYRQKNLC